jgi:hypothetical protein
MSMTVQSAGGPEWPKRELSPIRPSAARNDADHDKWSAANRQSAANPYDQAIDSLRTAALRRDAALVKTSHTTKADHATADAAIAEESKPETAQGPR